VKTIIIGSDGFVGQNLTRRGNLSALCFDNGFLHTSLREGTEFVDITRDLKNLENCLRIHRGAFKVINLAAIHHIPYCTQHPDEAMLVNVLGNMKLFELVAEFNCQHYIFASSGAVYNPNTNHHAESDQRRSSDVYSATKILAEDYLSMASSSYNLPVTSLRFFNIVGAYDVTPHLVPDIVDQIFDDSKCLQLGNLKTVRDYIGVNDICDVIETIINSDATELYSTLNVGTGVGYTGHQILKLINRLTDNDKELIQDPKRFRVSDRPSQVADTRKLETLIGKSKFEPLSKSLSDYIDWRKQLQ
jgi:UDP-glucose 4-epimerase